MPKQHHLTEETKKDIEQPEEKVLGVFEKYLSLWVFLCIVAGILIGKFFPAFPAFLGKFEYAQVSLPIAVLIWLMIYPMMLKIDFSCLKDCFNHPKGLAITLVSNWLIKPFTMFAFAYLFLAIIFKNFIDPALANEYIAGAILLGAAPCTAMVFVWSYLTKGNPAYTLLQVAINDLIILIAFVPIVSLLLGVGGITIPYNTLFLSIGLFVVVPFLAAFLTRKYHIKKKGQACFEQSFLPKFKHITEIGLLFTLIIIFSFQGETILNNPFHIALIAIPLIIQTFFIFSFAYLWAKKWRVPHDIAAPAGMIGASNFFELAVAVAISLFGVGSGAVLVTVVGVLVEVPIMLTLVKIANNTKGWFENTNNLNYGK
ncbi:MAG: ACR3 family arsenite efflux transporter [Candidatus Moranbacteria bacterium]|nr:ACR3 family arsenite efflux transporter [Candidatus Moranbacteria bacterium]